MNSVACRMDVPVRSGGIAHQTLRNSTVVPQRTPLRKRSPRAHVAQTSAVTSLRQPAQQRGKSSLHQNASMFNGRRLSSSDARSISNGTTRLSARWVENTAKVDVDIPLPIAWDMWDKTEMIPTWMPWISSVKVIEEEPKRKSEWTLSTHQFGRDWQFSWVATNLTPVKYQKIHWQASEGLNNTGAVRFFKKPEKNKCAVSLTISYEIPQALAPVGEALVPLVEGILQKDMERFAEYSKEYAKQFVKKK
eukprot:CAMPEP_0118934916 /NCGR_PEP_ID=MMETSP1169-20130426/14485_1 /TAXON_ID=36882 /ORGANISM="Pyramimonas obovata, Strain CCMP722" /LENGTH=248 /DNA_ID=CAMNT_0006877879 /DNA_START=61 /DNA_END=810 /DNA_ORIENTATION=-